MAKLIIISSEQVKTSLARFKKLLAKDQAERERLEQIQQRVRTGGTAAQQDSPSTEEKRA